MTTETIAEILGPQAPPEKAQKPAPRPNNCRCGQPTESFAANGVRYRTGTCRRCGDLEFSQRWQARYDHAKQRGDSLMMASLSREADDWERKGRSFHATRPRQAQERERERYP